MRIVRFSDASGGTGAGILDGDTIRVIAEPFWEQVEETGRTVALQDVRLLQPCQPRSVVCVGLNYRSHLHGRPVPDPPTLFFKPLSSLAGPGDPIVLPDEGGRIEPEGEIVIVIGRPARRVSRDQAAGVIFGYTAGNDVSAREWQSNDGQWWRAKGSDTFGPFGPAIATDLDPDSIEVTTRINGEEVQHGRSDELILDIPAIVEYVSAVMTLVPGDIIYSGTPGLPQPINPGDVVEVDVTGAGVLRNPVEAPRVE